MDSRERERLAKELLEPALELVEWILTRHTEAIIEGVYEKMQEGKENQKGGFESE